MNNIGTKFGKSNKVQLNGLGTVMNNIGTKSVNA